jgi:hypothetical protein
MGATSGGWAAVGMGAAGGWEIPTALGRLQLIFVNPGSQRMGAAGLSGAPLVGQCGARCNTLGVTARVNSPKHVLSFVLRCLACVIARRIILLNSKWLTNRLNRSCRNNRVVSIEFGNDSLSSKTVVERVGNTLIKIEVQTLFMAGQRVLQHNKNVSSCFY